MHRPTLLLLATTAAAHFTINTPPQKSPSSESALASGPCGGASLSFDDADSVADFHVGGDAVAVTGTHPQSNWLIRATNDTSGEDGWMAVWQLVRQGGLGKMCQGSVSVPEEWVGSEGLIGVVANAEDGILFGVRFVEGTAEPPSSCTNTTSDISATEDSDLDALATSSGADADAGSDDSEADDEDEGEDGSAAGLRAGLLAVGLGLVGSLVL